MYRSLSVTLLVLLVGCLDADQGAEPCPSPTAGPTHEATPTDGLPMYRDLPADFDTLILTAFGDAENGVRIKLWDNRAYVTTGNATDGIAIFDITDPYRPVRLGSVLGIAPREGLDMLDYGDRLVVVASAGDMVFFDVTDPSTPEEIARIQVASHTLAAHHAGHVVYNGAWTGAEPSSVEVVDARDPTNIRLHKVWEWDRTAPDGTPIQPTGCHDVIVDQLLNRAYCAAQGQTTVWSLDDPLDPRIISAVTTPTAPHHNTAFPILNGTVLVISQEEAGCGPQVAGLSSPAGLWFYDLKTSPPSVLSWWSVDHVDAERPGVYSFCAPHFGSEVGEGTGMLSFGWFEHGLVLVDASNPRIPKLAYQSDEGGSTSDAVYYRGLVFAAGEQGGLQVAVPE